MPLVGGFSRESPVFPAPSFRCRSTFTSITLIGSQDLAVKSRQNLFTHYLYLPADHVCRTSCIGRRRAVLNCYTYSAKLLLPMQLPCTHDSTIVFSRRDSLPPLPFASNIHSLSTCRALSSPGHTRAGRPEAPEYACPVLTSTRCFMNRVDRPRRVSLPVPEDRPNQMPGPCPRDTGRLLQSHNDSPPPPGFSTPGLQSHKDGSGLKTRLPLWEVALGFRMCGIVPDDIAGRWVSSGVSRFPRPCIQILLHTHFTSPSSTLKTSIVRAVLISLHHANKTRAPAVVDISNSFLTCLGCLVNV
ncbi:hypothetical protein PR048_019281 [Dryococelus australis]|uniref:Uncharacterized protein n=1 Tax=Dryococelus australis TaxID=614101 RepID=A0ABQ9H334_9NEOP|nr:hypothetical protein PR048_019281 [Dryococelus australis]